MKLCALCGHDPETEKLSRRAARAEGANEAAAAVRAGALLVLANFEESVAKGETVPLAVLRRTLEQAIDAMVCIYDEQRQETINRFVADVQRKLRAREFPGRAER